jgi:hypothetical protein
MINYAPMTLLQAYNEIVDRLGHYRNAENTDWGTIVKCVNRAVIEVCAKSLPYKDWAYITKLNIQDGTLLPREYMNYSRCLVQNLSGDLREARFVDVREYWNLTDPNRKHAWNMSLSQKPIFTIWGTGAPSRLTIYISPQADGLLEYHTIPNSLSQEADELPVPFEYQHYVVLSALTRVVSRFADLQYLVSIQKDIQGELVKMNIRHNETKTVKKRELDNFVEPQIPLAPPRQEPGELIQRMAK